MYRRAVPARALHPARHSDRPSGRRPHRTTDYASSPPSVPATAKPSMLCPVVRGKDRGGVAPVNTDAETRPETLLSVAAPTRPRCLRSPPNAREAPLRCNRRLAKGKLFPTLEWGAAVITSSQAQSTQCTHPPPMPRLPVCFHRSARRSCSPGHGAAPEAHPHGLCADRH